MNSAPSHAPSAPPAADLREPWLLVSGDFVRTGGMDMGNYSLASYLARLDLPLHIAAHRIDPALEAHPNVHFHPVPRPRRLMIAGELALYRAGRRLAQTLGEPRLRTLVNGGNCPLPDVNWVHYVHAAFAPQTAGNWLRRAKIALTHRIYLRTEERVLRSARILITNSERTKHDLLTHYGIEPARIHTIYYGTDPTLFYPADDAERRQTRATLGLPPDRFLVAFVGALGDRRKGFDTVFEAWRKLPLELAAQMRLLVIGRGAELPRWRRRAAADPAGRTIEFLGFRPDVPLILRACDAFAAPARYEAFGLAALEALCCGLPAIVSRQAGVAERYPPALQGLLLADPEDSAQLAAKLGDLCVNRAQWTAPLRALATELRQYTWEDMSRSMHAVMSPGGSP